MAIDAKMSLVSQMEKRLSGALTVEQMDTMKTALMDALEHFRVDELVMDDEDDDMLDCFLSAMTVQNRSEKTIVRYRYIIGRLMDFVKVPTRRITIFHIRKYIEAEKQRGIKDSTLEGNRQIFSSFFGWLWREGLIERNPMANMGTIKVPKKERKEFTDVDLEKLNNACTGLRDRALLNFMASSGCRISEITGLNRDSVNLTTLECVVHGKGDKERTVFLSDVTGMLLRDYLAQRTDDNEALFIGLRKERLLPGGVRQMLNRLSERSHVENVHPHRFRRTRATTLARHGMPIQAVAKILGHEKIDTTMRYVNVNKDDIKYEFRRYA